MKKHKYILVHPNNYYSYHINLRDITQQYNIDYSNLSKLIRNKKYVTIGNNKRGRPKKNENAADKPSYKLYKISDLQLKII
jgi:hypothetical protein